MCFLFSIVPATFWAILAYLVLYASTKLDGPARTLGQGLAIWAFIIAAFIPMAGAYVTLSDLCPIEAMVSTMFSETP